MLGQIEHKLFINCVEKFSQLFKFISVKKIYFYIILLLFIFNKSFACQLLNVPIGSNVSSAVSTFEFIDAYSADVYGDEFSAKYQDYAQDYCEGSSLENSDLEVIVYNSKIAGINLVNSHSNSKNEIYEFVKMLSNAAKSSISLSCNISTPKSSLSITILSLFFLLSKFNAFAAPSSTLKRVPRFS